MIRISANTACLLVTEYARIRTYGLVPMDLFEYAIEVAVDGSVILYTRNTCGRSTQFRAARVI